MSRDKTHINRIKMTKEEWEAKGTELFGKDRFDWKFKCPSCGYIASVRQWKDVGAGSGEIAFSCIGRRKVNSHEAFTANAVNGGPCNYAGGGLFRLNPVVVTVDGDEVVELFAFAEDDT